MQPSPGPSWQSKGIATAGLVVGAVADVAQQSTAVHQVTYDNLASASVSGARSPWSANARISGVMGPNLTASLSPDAGHANRSDTVTCSIVEDGVQVARNSATGVDAMVTCTK